VGAETQNKGLSLGEVVREVFSEEVALLVKERKKSVLGGAKGKGNSI
jgi:hypothetical protein